MSLGDHHCLTSHVAPLAADNVSLLPVLTASVNSVKCSPLKNSNAMEASVIRCCFCKNAGWAHGATSGPPTGTSGTEGAVDYGSWHTKP